MAKGWVKFLVFRKKVLLFFKLRVVCLTENIVGMLTLSAMKDTGYLLLVLLL